MYLIQICMMYQHCGSRVSNTNIYDAFSHSNATTKEVWTIYISVYCIFVQHPRLVPTFEQKGMRTYVPSICQVELTAEGYCRGIFGCGFL